MAFRVMGVTTTGDPYNPYQMTIIEKTTEKKCASDGNVNNGKNALRYGRVPKNEPQRNHEENNDVTPPGLESKKASPVRHSL